MTASSYEPLLDRVYEILVDGYGTSRTIPVASRFAIGSYPGQDPTVKSSLASVQKLVYAAIVRDQPIPSPENHSKTQYRVTVQVIADYFCEPEQDLASWRQVVATVAYDRHLVRSALGWPGNLTATEASAVTGLSGGCLQYQSGNTTEPSSTQRLVRSTMNFEGIVSMTFPA